jgi:hypothetical protein
MAWKINMMRNTLIIKNRGSGLARIYSTTTECQTCWGLVLSEKYGKPFKGRQALIVQSRSLRGLTWKIRGMMKDNMTMINLLISNWLKSRFFADS